MIRTVRIRWLLSTILLAGLAGCGGGGGGGGGGGSDAAAPGTTADQPTASFSVSDSDGFAPLAVTFDARASSIPGSTITRYHWDFGDETTASGAVVEHTYRDTGLFQVTLEIADDAAVTVTARRGIRVRGIEISGTVSITAASGADSDVNDRLTAPVSNNDFSVAQPVNNPLLLGGFVNQPGTGEPSGNFATSGDIDDYFVVDLDGTERIVLSIADTAADLDLLLYDDAPEPLLVDASISDDSTEDLQAPAPGRYFIRVTAVSGASNYVLSISQGSAITSTRARRLSDAFVPGDLLVAGQAAPIRRFALVHEPNRARYRLLPEPGSDLAPPDTGFEPVVLAPGSRIRPGDRLRYQTLLAARRLGQDPAIAVADLNLLHQPLRIPNDPLYEVQWHYPAIALEQAWDLSTGEGTGDGQVVVAVADTGVMLDHPDLRNQLLRRPDGSVVGYDFIQNATRASDGDGIDPDPDDPGDDAFGPATGSFHGTHVAGTIAAESDNGIGVAGVSWGARIMPLRVLGIGGGTTYDLMQALRYAARLDNASGTLPPVAADIVNMSLGSDFYSESEQRTINEVRSQGVILVASAGNSNSERPSFPAAYDGVISVGAIDIQGNRAYYSNYGSSLDVMAPGGDMGEDRNGDSVPDGIASTAGEIDAGVRRTGYAVLQGTSMAAPHVSGVIALMKSVFPALMPQDVDALLAAGAMTDDRGAPGRDDEYGWGVINAEASVLAALDLSNDAGGISGVLLTTSTGRLDFQDFTRSLNFSIDNLGPDPVSVDVGADAPWLSISYLGDDPGGLGTYLVEVDRDLLTDGSYSAEITITPDAPDADIRRIAVSMRVTSPAPAADAGLHYILLVDAEDDSTVLSAASHATGGEYPFVLSDVPPGEYRLFAGTDLNDDDYICDGGEACGAWPGLSNPEIIVIDDGSREPLDNLDFASEFRTTLNRTGSAAERSPAPGQTPARPLPILEKSP